MVSNPQFLELLVSQGIVAQEEIERLKLDYRSAFSILVHLMKKGVAKKRELGKLWGDSLGVAFVDLGKVLFQPEVVQKLPQDLARKNHMILLYQLGGGVTAALSDPTRSDIIREAQRIIGKPINPLFAFREDIEDAIEIQYRSVSHLEELSNRMVTNKIVERNDEIAQEQLSRIASEQAVADLTRELILLALKHRASDVHIEPGEFNMRIRFRIDGVLQEKMTMDKSVLPSLLSRLRALANVDITEKRAPQHGRMNINLSNRSADIRFSSVPTIHGERIALRIPSQTETGYIPDLSDLSFSKTVLDELKKVIERPEGILFVTGPAGSGKTTTLFSILDYLNKPGVNIMTVEDPVEYRLEGINQVQINETMGASFPSTLRSFLHQDPDIILIGETRDSETAKIAVQAALTGHMVLTSMCTNNALQVAIGMMETGLESFPVAPPIIAVMAQRLVRRICEQCKEEYLLSPEEVEELFIWDGKKTVHFYRGKGCSQCDGTGYLGRIAIHQIFIMNDELRKVASKGASILEIQKYIREKYGFQSMHYDGIKKVLQGLTTIDEIRRVIPEDV
jgi:type IV pilus assembly protein PilB